jgi:hypothetical protein
MSEECRCGVGSRVGRRIQSQADRYVDNRCSAPTVYQVARKIEPRVVRGIVWRVKRRIEELTDV